MFLIRNIFLEFLIREKFLISCNICNNINFNIKIENFNNYLVFFRSNNLNVVNINFIYNIFFNKNFYLFDYKLCGI